MLSPRAPLKNGPYGRSSGWALLKLEDLIRRSPAKVYYRKWRNMGLEGVIKVTFHILDPDIIRFRHDPFISISILYLTIKSQMLNRCRALQWLTVLQQPILKFNKYTVYECILIISEHQSTNTVSWVLFKLCTEQLSKVWNSEIFWCIPVWG